MVADCSPGMLNGYAPEYVDGPRMVFMLEKTLNYILVSTQKIMRQKTDSFGI